MEGGIVPDTEKVIEIIQEIDLILEELGLRYVPIS